MAVYMKINQYNTLNMIINARMEEVFSLVKDRIEQACPNIPLSAGVFLTGGCSYMTGVRDLGQKVFNAPCSLGKPFDVTGLASAKDGPLYAVHVGCIRYVDSLQEKEVKRTFSEQLMKWVWGGRHG